MIDLLFLIGAVLVAVGLSRIVGGRIAHLWRRDRQVNAARQQVARGVLSDPDLMAIAYAVRADKRRRVKSDPRVANRAVAMSQKSIRGMAAEWDRRAVVAAAELICKESAR